MGNVTITLFQRLRSVIKGGTSFPSRVNASTSYAPYRGGRAAFQTTRLYVAYPARKFWTNKKPPTRIFSPTAPNLIQRASHTGPGSGAGAAERLKSRNAASPRRSGAARYTD